MFSLILTRFTLFLSYGRENVQIEIIAYQLLSHDIMKTEMNHRLYSYSYKIKVHWNWFRIVIWIYFDTDLKITNFNLDHDVTFKENAMLIE